MALPERFRVSGRYLLYVVTRRRQIAGNIVRCHAGFNSAQALRHVYKSCGDPAASDLIPQNDCTLLIQANHMQRVLAGIDANRADGCGVCPEGHGGVLLVLLSLRSLSERFGAGARPVHSILRARSRLAASRATMRARHVGLGPGLVGED
jgi:hypothetical protein